jgi:hypothetical protein
MKPSGFFISVLLCSSIVPESLAPHWHLFVNIFCSPGVPQSLVLDFLEVFEHILGYLFKVFV